MSIEALGRFLGDVANDKALAERLKADIGAREGRDAEEAVAAAARGNGFDVEADDVARLRSAVNQAHRGEGDLSDDELDRVAGGGDTLQRVSEGIATFGLSELFRFIDG